MPLPLHVAISALPVSIATLPLGLKFPLQTGIAEILATLNVAPSGQIFQSGLFTVKTCNTDWKHAARFDYVKTFFTYPKLFLSNAAFEKLIHYFIIHTTTSATCLV